MMMAMLQVLYSLEDISYDVQQSYFSGLKDKKRQKTGKVTVLLSLSLCDRMRAPDSLTSNKCTH
jgi:hypothetical protein